MFNVGPTELIVILIVALIVFGPKRLPEIGRTLGRSLQEFRKASNDLRQEIEQHLGDGPAQPTVASQAEGSADSADGAGSPSLQPSHQQVSGAEAPEARSEDGGHPSHDSETGGPTLAG